MIRKLFAAALIWLAAISLALPQTPQTLPPNTVLGRMGIGPGKAQAIPFATLATQLFLPTGPRPILTGSPIFYVSTTGSDVTGDGTLTKPYASALIALFNLVVTYDLGATQPIIQYEDGTYDLSSGTGAFLGSVPVGGSVIKIQGNLNDATKVVLDGITNANGASGIFLGPGAQFTLNVGGITFKNLSRALNCQVNSGNISITGPVIFAGGNDLDMDAEGNCSITSGGTTITFSGTSNQLMYVANGAFADFNSTQVIFQAGATFNGGLYAADFGGRIQIYNNITGAPTGKQFGVDRGGIISFTDPTGFTFLNASSMPGTTPGINTGGWFNHNFGTAPVTVANLPTCTSTTPGLRATVSNSNSTTFANAVVGGGINTVPVYCDSSGVWRIG